MKSIYENSEIGIKVQLTGQDYDFIAVVENEGDVPVTVCPKDEADSDCIFEAFAIPAHDWVGVLADENARNLLNAVKHSRVVFAKEGGKE